MNIYEHDQCKLIWSNNTVMLVRSVVWSMFLSNQIQQHYQKHKIIRASLTAGMIHWKLVCWSMSSSMFSSLLTWDWESTCLAATSAQHRDQFCLKEEAKNYIKYICCVCVCASGSMYSLILYWMHVHFVLVTIYEIFCSYYIHLQFLAGFCIPMTEMNSSQWALGIKLYGISTRLSFSYSHAFEHGNSFSPIEQSIPAHNTCCLERSRRNFFVAWSAVIRAKSNFNTRLCMCIHTPTVTAFMSEYNFMLNLEFFIIQLLISEAPSPSMEELPQQLQYLP